MGVIEAVEAVNERQKSVVFHKLEQMLGSLKGKTIALWGLSFKPETDDMREAPSLVVIDLLLKAGANIRAYDPVAMEECRRRIGDKITYCKDLYDAAVEADAVALMTEWKQFRVPSWAAVKRVMRGDVLVDGRNIFDKEELLSEGFRYKAIGK